MIYTFFGGLFPFLSNDGGNSLKTVKKRSGDTIRSKKTKIVKNNFFYVFYAARSKEQRDDTGHVKNWRPGFVAVQTFQ